MAPRQPDQPYPQKVVWRHNDLHCDTIFLMAPDTPLGIVTVRPGGRTAPKPAVQWTVRRRYGGAVFLTTLDGTGRWAGRPSGVDGGQTVRQQVSWLNLKPA
jgi:hypothetical protein